MLQILLIYWLYKYVDFVWSFTWIVTFLQPNPTVLLIPDLIHHCLVLFNRLDNQTMSLLGNCSQRGYADGVMPLFNQPYILTFDVIKKDQILLFDKGNNAKRGINTRNWSVVTLTVFNSSNRYTTHHPESERKPLSDFTFKHFGVWLCHQEHHTYCWLWRWKRQQQWRVAGSLL